RGSENHHWAGDCDLDCTGSTYYRHQGRLGGHDDRSETGGWVITGASSHHWSGRGRQSTALAEPRAPGGRRSFDDDPPGDAEVHCAAKYYEFLAAAVARNQVRTWIRPFQHLACLPLLA